MHDTDNADDQANSIKDSVGKCATESMHVDKPLAV
jgi:hypothetical protein